MKSLLLLGLVALAEATPVVNPILGVNSVLVHTIQQPVIAASQQILNPLNPQYPLNPAPASPNYGGGNYNELNKDSYKDIISKQKQFRVIADERFQWDCIDQINAKRQSHESTRPLNLGYKFVNYTVDRAHSILRDIENKRDIAKGRLPLGESFFWYYDPNRYRSQADAINTWYEERRNYDYNYPGFSAKTGGFTQLIWKSTKEVSCAKIDYETREHYKTLVVCNFYPAGNVNGEFPYNVMPVRRGGGGGGGGGRPGGGGGRPEYPDNDRPSRPGGGGGGRPGGGRPEYPDEDRPNRPGGGGGGRPGGGRPEYPDNDRPSRPGGGRPGRPDDNDRPNRPGGGGGGRPRPPYDEDDYDRPNRPGGGSGGYPTHPVGATGSTQTINPYPQSSVEGVAPVDPQPAEPQQPAAVLVAQVDPANLAAPAIAPVYAAGQLPQSQVTLVDPNNQGNQDPTVYEPIEAVLIMPQYATAPLAKA